MRGLTVHNHQRDPNEAELVRVARKLGKFVTRIKSSDPSGHPDLVVITPGPDVPVFVARTVEQMHDICLLNEPICLVEVKPGTQKLRPSQETWHKEARNADV